MIEKNICIIANHTNELHENEYILGVQSAANSLGYITTLFTMLQLNDKSTNNEEEIFDLIDFSQYCGVILVARSFSSHKSLINTLEIKLKNECNLPIAVIGESSNFTDTYSIDKETDFEKLTDHIIEVHGCEKIFLLGGMKGVNVSVENGFKKSMTRHDIDTAGKLLYGGYWINCAEKLAQDIAFGNIERPEAVMCYTDTIALALIQSLYKYNIRVPEDILVTGCSGHPCAFNNIMPITTILPDAQYAGKLSVASIHKQLTGEDVSHEYRKKSSSISMGLSCGCGIQKTVDIRAKLDLFERTTNADMYFRNSYIEEAFFRAKSIEELSLLIADYTYIVMDATMISISLFTDETKKQAKCIFHTNYIEGKNITVFDSPNLLPIDNLKNYTISHLVVLPIIFDKKMYGFITAGYDVVRNHGDYFRRFASRIAAAIDIISSRGEIQTNQEEPSIDSTTTPEFMITTNQFTKGEKSGAIFAIKDGVMCKVVTENILYFEALQKKVFVTLKSGSYEVKQTLSDIEETLIDKGFMRISKSIVVNMDKIVSFKPDSDRTIIATLVNKGTVRVSRKYITDFKNSLNL